MKLHGDNRVVLRVDKQHRETGDPVHHRCARRPFVQVLDRFETHNPSGVILVYLLYVVCLPKPLFVGQLEPAGVEGKAVRVMPVVLHFTGGVAIATPTEHVRLVKSDEFKLSLCYARVVQVTKSTAKSSIGPA